MAALEANGQHRFREQATANTIWTIYGPWNFAD